MKRNNLKSILGIAFMSLLLTAFTTTNISAQGNSRNNLNPEKKENPKKANTSKGNANKAKPSPVNKDRAATPVKQYSKQPSRGAAVKKSPRKSVVIRHHNLDYHYRDGIFYRPQNGNYIIASPPVGIHISVLPPNPYRVILSGHSYYYYYGTYYSPLRNGGYEVVAPPVGARVDALPDGYEVFELEGIIYYRLDETYYKAVLEPNGYVTYEVVRV